MTSIKQQRSEMIASGGLEQNSLLGASTSGRHARWIVSSDIPMSLDAIGLCERVADEVLEAHRAAIEAGQLADGSGPQAPLEVDGEAGRAAAKGERPAFRGVTKKGSFPSGLSRTPVTFRAGKLTSGRVGTRARTVISASAQLRGWLRKEAERGVEYFKTGGTIGELVQATLLAWADAEILQRVTPHGPRDRRARKHGPKAPEQFGPKRPRSR
jgi:hypothetical protein